MMSSREILLWTVLVGFTTFTPVVIFQHGLAGFVELGLANGVAVQIGLDLVIMLVAFAGWMIQDARSSGRNPWPFLLLICALGSIGALSYLIYRERTQALSPASA